MKKLILVLALLMFITSVNFAQANTPGINKTQKRQQIRIHQGIRTGELTRVEFRQLERQQARIQREKRIAKADGIVTISERARIHKYQTIANRNIYCKKNNKRDRS